MSGRATVECAATAAGSVENCRVVSETPAGAGFGEATLVVTPKFRIARTDTEGRAVAGGTIRIPMLWTVSDDRESLQRSLGEVARER